MIRTLLDLPTRLSEIYGALPLLPHQLGFQVAAAGAILAAVLWLLGTPQAGTRPPTAPRPRAQAQVQVQDGLPSSVMLPMALLLLSGLANITLLQRRQVRVELAAVQHEALPPSAAPVPSPSQEKPPSSQTPPASPPALEGDDTGVPPAEAPRIVSGTSTGR